MLHEEPLVRLGRVVRGQVRCDQEEFGVEGQLDVEAPVLPLYPFHRLQVLSALYLLQLSAGCLLEMQRCQRLLEILLDSPVKSGELICDIDYAFLKLPILKIFT